MTEAQAKKQLRHLLRALTLGSVLHLLSEMITESARRARGRGNKTIQKEAQEVPAALYAMGLGVDVVWPR